MPHLTLQLHPIGGPLVAVYVGVTAARADALKLANQPVPPPVQVQGLIDTGASGLAVDPTVIAALGITPTDVVPMHTPSTAGAPKMVNQYDVALHLWHPAAQHITTAAVPALECHLANQGIQVLIGRSVLKQCLLVYDGPTGTFALAF